MDNIQNNCGIYMGAGGYFKAKKSKITINPSAPGTSTATRNNPFRFNIPTPNRHFKGRKHTMEAVRNYFITLPPQPIDCWERVVAIAGLGGMGKTETAYKFAAEVKETFPNVAWINAETESSALASFLGLAKHLKIVANDRKEADLDLVREVYQHLDQEDNGRVLFIFDNAIRLNSDEKEFGIIEYLPVDDLPNQRIPYVLITTQTQDWGRRIETFQVDELTEVESLEFFRSCFAIESAECDDLFKKLHELLEGYPLVMNLAASQLDYNPKRHSVHQLKKQIQNYIGKLEKENTKILHEKFNQAWPTKYKKTLSNVWQLTFERIQQEDKDNGRGALELLQLISFLNVPTYSNDLVELFLYCSECPHPSQEESQFRLKELIGVLERFYIVRILREIRNDEKEFRCELGIHRLVQLVVREQLDSSKVLEGVLFYVANKYNSQVINLESSAYPHSVNESALEEALHKIPLSQQALAYVGVLACNGFPPACKFVETRQPETKAASTIWRLYFMERGMQNLDENATKVLRELIELTKAEERLSDRSFFRDITIGLLTNADYCKHTREDGTNVPEYFVLNTVDGIEGLVAQLIIKSCSVHDLSCRYHYCVAVSEHSDERLAQLTVKISKKFMRADAPYSKLTVVGISDTWFAVFASLKRCKPHEKGLPRFFVKFWEDMNEAFRSPRTSQSRIGALKRCLWNRGLAKELIQVFEFLSHYFDPVNQVNNLWLLQIIEFGIDGMDLKDKRVQEVLSSICQMVATFETRFISEDYSDARLTWIGSTVSLCSFWVKLFLMNEDPPSHKSLDSLSKLKFLVWMERSPELNKWNSPFFGYSMSEVPFKYRANHFTQFIKRFSSSDIKPIRTLVNVIWRLMEDNAVYNLIRKKHNLKRMSASSFM